MPGPLRTLITSLATFGATVANIAASYDIDATPTEIDVLNKLPCLLIGQIMPEGRSGFEFGAFMGNAASLPVRLKHVLVAALASLEQVNVDPFMVDMLDAYNTAAQAQKFLSYGAGQCPLAYVPEFVRYQHGRYLFWAIEFAHAFDMPL